MPVLSQCGRKLFTDMKLKQMQANRLCNDLKGRSNYNYFRAKKAMDYYYEGKANERRTIKELSQIYEDETVCVKRMMAILKKYLPECENPQADAVLVYIAQYI
jgi:hypothetical protein